MTDDAPLETGYGPDSLSGDNLGNDFQQETARSIADLGLARGDRVERINGLLTMTDANSPLPFSNRAVLEQWSTTPNAPCMHCASTKPAAKGRICSTAHGRRLTCARTYST